ncbi:hypothetical protein BH23PLA1_BH23PLA1_11240 [soil metagenome]
MPREVRPRRSRRQQRHRQRRRVAIVLAVVLLVPTLAGCWIRAQSRLESWQALTAALDEADEAERLGWIDQAYGAVESAVLLAAARRIEPPGGLPALLHRRAELSRRDLEARLETLEALDPDLALGEALTLRERARRDPAPPALIDRVEAALIKARDRWLSADRSQLRTLLEEGRHAEALTAAERMLRRSEALPTGIEDRARDEIWALAMEVVDRAAVAIPPIEPDAPLLFDRCYDEDLRPQLVEVLKRAGYLIRPTSSPFLGLWDKAPYRLTIDVIKERWGPGYLQSAHRSTQIEIGVSLRHRDDPEPVWRDYIAARTRSSPRAPEATQAIRLGLGVRRNPTIERLLYDDARDDLLEKLLTKLRSLPSCQPTPRSSEAENS